MNKLTQALMEELTVEYVKVGSLQIPESVVISWVILAIVGFVVKGLMWLAWVAIILVAITVVIGFFAGLFSGD